MAHMPIVKLFNGECDGYSQRVQMTDRPDVFYAVPLLDMENIKKTIRDPLAKQAAIEAARRLAYAYKGVDVGGEELVYRYERDAAQDKVEDL